MAEPLNHKVPRAHLGHLEGALPGDKLPSNGTFRWLIHVDENPLANLIIADLESLGGLLATALVQGEFLIRQDVQPDSDGKECAQVRWIDHNTG